MFALGASLLELAQASRLPNSGEHWQAIRERGAVLCHSVVVLITAVTGVDPHSLSELLPELSRKIQQLLHPDPSQRPTAEQLCSELAPVNIQEQRALLANSEPTLTQQLRDAEEVWYIQNIDAEGTAGQISRLQQKQLDDFQSFAQRC